MTTPTDDLNREPYLVSTNWLAERLDDPAIVLIDCRYYFDGRDALAEYSSGHIPGAVHLDWSKKLVDPHSPRTGTFKVPAPERLRTALEPLGVSDSSMVVGYDDEGGHFVSRVLATLASYGYDNVRILEGGIVKWRAEGRSLTTDVPQKSPGHLSFSHTNADTFASIDDVLEARNDSNVVVLDVRRHTEVTGEEARARRGGHIPWARWLLWQDNLHWDGDRSFKDAATLRARYESAGATPDKRIITYCQGGVRAAHTALTLQMLGYPDVRIYDGSWEEWGNRDDVPVAEGPVTPP